MLLLVVASMCGVGLGSESNPDVYRRSDLVSEVFEVLFHLETMVDEYENDVERKLNMLWALISEANAASEKESEIADGYFWVDDDGSWDPDDAGDYLATVEEDDWAQYFEE